MRDFNLDFLDLYKNVDSFLKDAYSSNNGVTNYIQEMERQFEDGNKYVQNWRIDYDRLKHMRWLRNQFAHELSFDAEILEQEDYDWLDSFYKKLFSATDPIALLYTVKRKQKVKAVQKPHQMINNASTSQITLPSQQQTQYNFGLSDEKLNTVVTGLEMFRKTLDFCEAGDNVGALLRGITRDQVERGQVLCKPGSIHPHTKFSGQVYVLKKEEGGRHTPFFNNYRPQFYFRTTDVTGVVTLPADKEMCMPGDNVAMDVELITPIAIEEGLRFAIREGGRTVGSGVVTKINE